MTQDLGVGFVGTGWMARAHAHALHTLRHIAPPERPVRLTVIAGRDAARTRAAASRLGFARHTTDWRSVVEDPDVDLVANVAGNDAHAEPSIAALAQGKSVLCEKPLATSVAEAEDMVTAAENARGLAVCGYNYRFVPALRLARELITAGRLGALRHFRATYLQDWAGTSQARQGWRFADPEAGSAVGDYSHIIDLLRWLAGEPVAVCGSVATLDGRGAALRPAVIGEQHEDWYAALVRTASGMTATLEASRVATGWKGRQSVEIVGSQGALLWNMEDLNRLHVYLRDDEAGPVAGFRDVLVTEPHHPFLEHWWAPGHILGWEHTFVHEWHAVVRALQPGGDRFPDLPSFADGLRAARITAAIRASAESGSWVEIP